MKKFTSFETQLGESVVLTDKAKLSLYKKSSNSGISVDILEEVYRRGHAIWKESFGGTPDSFAFDRVNSFVSGGFATQLDEDLLDEKRGLWDNIHAKRARIKAGSGERMRKPGSKGAPTDAAIKASQNEDTDPCWKGYKQIGMKMKGGRKVPNCVPVKEQSAETLARKHDVSIASIKNAIEQGRKVEKEHTNSSKEAEKIAKDHLKERPDYYKKLKQMEKSPVSEGKIRDKATKGMKAALVGSNLIAAATAMDPNQTKTPGHAIIQSATALPGTAGWVATGAHYGLKGLDKAKEYMTGKKKMSEERIDRINELKASLYEFIESLEETSVLKKAKYVLNATGQQSRIAKELRPDEVEKDKTYNKRKKGLKRVFGEAINRGGKIYGAVEKSTKDTRMAKHDAKPKHIRDLEKSAFASVNIPSHLSASRAKQELEYMRRKSSEATYGKDYPSDIKPVREATYQGKTVPLNKPMKGDVKKSKVYVDPDGDGKAQKVNFGDKNMSIKKDQPGRKKSYCARSGGIKGTNDKTSANYWSRRAWNCSEETKINEDGFDFDAVTNAVKNKESGGNYGLKSKSSSASGAYQYTKGTWGGSASKYGVDTKQYPNAVSAPKEVQDKVFMNDLKTNSDKYGLEKAVKTHYSGNPAGYMKPSVLAKNGGQTADDYLNDIKKRVDDYNTERKSTMAAASQMSSNFSGGKSDNSSALASLQPKPDTEPTSGKKQLAMKEAAGTTLDIVRASRIRSEKNAPYDYAAADEIRKKYPTAHRPMTADWAEKIRAKKQAWADARAKEDSMKEESEKHSKNQKDPRSRFIGSKELTAIYRKNTPGQD